MDLKIHLQQLFERYESDVGAYAWLYEADRWAELVFCLLNQSTGHDPASIRQAVRSLQELRLLAIDTLAVLEVPGNENLIVFTHVLRRYGFSEETALDAVALLARAATVIQISYGRKIQRYLRRHGEIMRDELVNAFAGAFPNPEPLRAAVSQWLQNTLSLPISLEHQAVTAFCQQHGATVEDLLRAADELDLNVALVDDLLELDQLATQAVPEEGL